MNTQTSKLFSMCKTVLLFFGGLDTKQLLSRDIFDKICLKLYTNAPKLAEV